MAFSIFDHMHQNLNKSWTQVTGTQDIIALNQIKSNPKNSCYTLDSSSLVSSGSLNESLIKLAVPQFTSKSKPWVVRNQFLIKSQNPISETLRKYLALKENNNWWPSLNSETLIKTQSYKNFFF